MQFTEGQAHMQDMVKSFDHDQIKPNTSEWDRQGMFFFFFFLIKDMAKSFGQEQIKRCAGEWDRHGTFPL